MFNKKIFIWGTTLATTAFAVVNRAAIAPTLNLALTTTNMLPVIGIVSAASFLAAVIATGIYNRLGAPDGKDEKTRRRENMNFAIAILVSTSHSVKICLVLYFIGITPTFTTAALGALALTWFFGEYDFCAAGMKSYLTTCRNPGITQERINYYIQNSLCANEWLSIPVFGQRVIDLCQECVEVLKETVGLERSVA